MFCVFYAYMGCKNEYTLMLIFNKIYYSIAFRFLKNVMSRFLKNVMSNIVSTANLITTHCIRKQLRGDSSNCLLIVLFKF